MSLLYECCRISQGRADVDESDVGTVQERVVREISAVAKDTTDRIRRLLRLMSANMNAFEARK